MARSHSPSLSEDWEEISDRFSVISLPDTPRLSPRIGPANSKIAVPAVAKLNEIAARPDRTNDYNEQFSTSDSHSKLDDDRTAGRTQSSDEDQANQRSQEDDPSQPAIQKHAFSSTTARPRPIPRPIPRIPPSSYTSPSPTVTSTRPISRRFSPLRQISRPTPAELASPAMRNTVSPVVNITTTSSLNSTPNPSPDSFTSPSQTARPPLRLPYITPSSLRTLLIETAKEFGETARKSPLTERTSSLCQQLELMVYSWKGRSQNYKWCAEMYELVRELRVKTRQAVERERRGKKCLPECRDTREVDEVYEKVMELWKGRDGTSWRGSGIGSGGRVTGWRVISPRGGGMTMTGSLETQTGLLEGDGNRRMSEESCYGTEDNSAGYDGYFGDLEPVVARERKACRHPSLESEREMMERPPPYKERSRLAEPAGGYPAPVIQIPPPPPVGWAFYPEPRSYQAEGRYWGRERSTTAPGVQEELAFWRRMDGVAEATGRMRDKVISGGRGETGTCMEHVAGRDGDGWGEDEESLPRVRGCGCSGVRRSIV